MSSFKFLARGGSGPLSGFRWPLPMGTEPGPWVEVDGALTECARGIHVCRVDDLAHWLHDELWEVEVDGTSILGTDCVVVPRARLVRRVSAWSKEGRSRFVDAAIAHAVVHSDDARALLDDARAMGHEGLFALVAYTTALAVSRDSTDADAAFRAERAWQSRWIADLISL